MNMDLNLLLIFHKIYEERNLTHAASLLGLTQSAVSQALGRLRLHFDDQLFYRVSKGMEPTEKAHMIAPFVSASLLSAEQAFTATKEFDPTVSNQVFKIGMIDIDMVFFSRVFLKYFQNKAPNIRLVVVLSEPDNYLELMDKGEIDIVVQFISDKLPKRFSSSTIFQDNLVVISKNDHPHIGDKLTLEDFLHLPHLSVTLGQLEKMYIDPIFADNGLKRKVSLTLDHMLAVPAVIKETNLIATVYSTLMDYCEDINGITTHSFPVEYPPTPISLIWHQRVNGNKAFEWIIREIQSVFKEFHMDSK